MHGVLDEGGVPSGSKRSRWRWRTANATYWLVRHWLQVALGVLAVYALLPFVAPVAMRLGWESLGNAIYDVYSTQCHQMAQRSFFFFGPQVMYNLDELPVTYSGRLTDTLALRAFRGNEILGWKVAWSDRMVYMYGGLLLVGLAYGMRFAKRSPRPLRLRWVFLLMLPLALDGLTHLVSDQSGLAGGFRYHNEWLAQATGMLLPEGFYRGDKLGTFNSFVRFISGLMFAIGMGGLIFPMIDQSMRRNGDVLGAKLRTESQSVQ